MLATVAVFFASMLHAGPERPVAPPLAEHHSQTRPAIARAGTATLTAWIEEPVGTDILLLVVRVNEGHPLVVAEDRVRFVRVATDGQDYIVLWINRDAEIFARRVTRAGTMPDPAVKVAHHGWGAQPPCIAWTGTEYVVGYIKLVIWTRTEIVTDVWARRLTREGVPSGEGFQVVAGGNSRVACAASATTTLFVSGFSVVEGALLTHGGTLSGPFLIGSGQDADVASNGSNFLVAAYDRYSSYPVESIRRYSVTEHGTVTPKAPIEVTPVPYGFEPPAVSARPKGYLLLFGDSPLEAIPLDDEGNETGPAITLTDDAAFPAAVNDTIVYQRPITTPATQLWRVFTRTISELGKRRSVR